MAGRGRTIAAWSAVLGLLTLAAAGFLFQDALREAWHLHKLETGSLEEKLAAARRLGELRSARAAPALIETFRVLCVEAEGGYQPKSHGDFQEALRKIGKPALPALVRAVSRAISMVPQDLDEITPHNLDGAVIFYIFIHQAIEIIYLGKTPREILPILPGDSYYEFVDLRRILESLRDDTLASPALREAAIESLKAFP